METTPTGARFLHIYWHRVQEPQGTTNMDFEFNKSETLSANGVTPIRTAGDVLIQYDLSQGGTNPTLWISRWVTTGSGSLCEQNNATPCWGDRVNLTAAGDATGSINTSAIPAAESDGLGAMSPRTFGEASIDFDALGGGGAGSCVGFGSAYLKSRSSDSFTAALKDFIPPLALNFNDCGSLKITKTAKHAAATGGSQGQVATFTVDPPTGDNFTATTDATGVVCLDGLEAGSYIVTERCRLATWLTVTVWKP